MSAQRFLRLRCDRRHPRMVQESVRGRVRQDRDQGAEEKGEKEGKGHENPDGLANRIRRQQLWKNVWNLRVKQGWDLIGPAAEMGRGFFVCRYGDP